MIVTRVELPGPLAEALAAFFPTLVWERVGFFVGIPWPFSLGNEDGITLPYGRRGIGIYLRPGAWQPGSSQLFLLCVHELVHALQVQQSPAAGRGLGLLNAFIFHYLTCFFCARSAQAHRGNRYEDEAYDHEGLVALALALAHAGEVDATTLSRIDPRVIKRNAIVKGTCGAGAQALGAALLSAAVVALGAIVYAAAGLVFPLTGAARAGSTPACRRARRR